MKVYRTKFSIVGTNISSKQHKPKMYYNPLTDIIHEMRRKKNERAR